MVEGLDRAMQQWHGFEHIWNQAVPHKKRERAGARLQLTNPMAFNLRGHVTEGTFSTSLSVTSVPSGNELFICQEHWNMPLRWKVDRDATGIAKIEIENEEEEDQKYGDGEPVGCYFTKSYIEDWQFASLIPQAMGMPSPQLRTGGKVKMRKDGSNIAEYLLDFRKQDSRAFDGLIETLTYLLPYAHDLQPSITSELERNVYLQLVEGDFRVPGWLLSTGTLRLVALLALLRHPDPPPLIVIEEIENGLDPRSVHLIVDEIRNAVETGRTQVIMTTHSPYLLDLLRLYHIVLVERDNGQPVFSRPGDVASLAAWAEKFGPGQLYTMERLNKGAINEDRNDV